METLETYESFKKVLNEPFVMIVAKSHRCATCQVIVPHLEKNLIHLDQFKTYQIYVDDVEQFRGEHVIFSVPTVLIFNEGKEILRESRFIDISKINRLLEAYFN